MKLKILLLTLFSGLFFAHPVFATSHYSFEHSQQMLQSGKINWREYGQTAFNEAITQNKPIFLLLTAPSWCYWCHVYDSDDYLYNAQIYPILNDKFIPIYVDADKRQDLTRQYLEGGWPSTTIFAPNRERIFGYSGPRPIPFMLENLKNAVEYVNTHGFANKNPYDYQQTSPIIPTVDQLNSLINGYNSSILQAYDTTYGGFGTGQKFPQGRTLDYALEQYESTKDNKWLELVQNTLVNQYTKREEVTTNYKLFDPIEGGFHRYGTTRTWSPPHFEKMLYDNARLLKVYSHLLTITPNDPIAREVVDKTLKYVADEWYDQVNGGFYGNTDVGGEKSYYERINRTVDKPRVEKTKYSDWNSEAVLTYLYLWKTTKNEAYKTMANQTLTFFQKKMVTDKGVYHYQKEDGTKGVRGSLLDNAYALLAFTDGYETLGQKEYLESAIQIANYSLDNLYDWNSGGFF